MSKFPVPDGAAYTIHGALPAPPGCVVGRVGAEPAPKSPDQLTEAERALLEKAGWRPGDPIPDFKGTQLSERLSQQVEAIRKSASDDVQALSPIDPSAPPLDPPPPTPIEELPPDEQARAMQMFAEMDELQDRITRARINRARRDSTDKANPVMTKPGAAAAITQAQAAAQQQDTADPGVTLVDDVTTGAAPTHAPPQPVFRLKTDPPPKPEVQPEPAQQPAPPTPAQPAPDGLTRCPRCNHELAGELVVPTEQEVAEYMAALLGSGRFRKRVSLFGGRVVLILRGLRPKEADAAIQQADIDMANGRIHHVLQYCRVVEGYKMACGIEQLCMKGQKPITFPELSQIADDDEDKSPLMQVYDYLNNDVFTTESLRRAAAGAWQQFQQLLQYMETKAQDPDFFDRIV
jgi:hypothetical protein